MDENDILGVQLYPAGWPRKLQITLNNEGVKEKLIIEGLDIFGHHVEFRDENSTILKVILKDAPVEFNEETIIEIMEAYGDVVRVEKEMIYVDGRKTSWTTGTRFVFFSKLTTQIPPKINATLNGLTLSLEVTYRGQNEANEQKPTRCYRCGGDNHGVAACSFTEKVCYLCHTSGHAQKDCPRNDGTKADNDTLVFLSAQSPLSNWNTKYSFDIDGKTFNCVEQYVTYQKCQTFGDEEAAHEVMNEIAPRVMKLVGENIRNYDHRVWNMLVTDFVREGVRANFLTIKQKNIC